MKRGINKSTETLRLHPYMNHTYSLYHLLRAVISEVLAIPERGRRFPPLDEAREKSLIINYNITYLRFLRYIFHSITYSDVTLLFYYLALVFFYYFNDIYHDDIFS